jgi:stage II sporulation protein P
LAAAGLLLVLRPPAAGAVAALAPGGASAPSGPRLAVGDVLSWLATGSPDGPYALLRTVLPGMGLAAAPAHPAAAPPQLPDPPNRLRQRIHHPLPLEDAAPSDLVLYGVRPLVLIYQTDPTAGPVGRRLAQDLFSGYGIPVAHLQATFSGLDPYLAAETRLQALMRSYPSLHVLLDVHADAPPATATVAGGPAAPVMIVVGTDQTLPDPSWRQNAAWAVQVAAAIERTYPGLLRSYLGSAFYTDGGRFNQQLSPAALLLEIGGRGEAASLEMRGTDLLAEVLGPMIQAGQYPR